MGLRFAVEPPPWCDGGGHYRGFRDRRRARCDGRGDHRGLRYRCPMTPTLPTRAGLSGISVSFSCAASSHFLEQNGSSLRRAISGRSPPQHTQRPFRLAGGFALSVGSVPTRHEPTVSRHPLGRLRGVRTHRVAAAPAGGCTAPRASEEPCPGEAPPPLAEISVRISLIPLDASAGPLKSIRSRPQSEALIRSLFTLN